MAAQDPILELRRRALEHMALAKQEERKMLEAAIRAGEALLEAKRRVPPEQWDQWQRENLKFSLETAAEQMRLAQEHRREDES
jgi:hypothetical protein